jgi:hypothetical protein
MDQDVVHRLSPPSTAAGGRRRFSLVWKVSGGDSAHKRRPAQFTGCCEDVLSMLCCTDSLTFPEASCPALFVCLLLCCSWWLYLDQRPRHLRPLSCPYSSLAGPAPTLDLLPRWRPLSWHWPGSARQPARGTLIQRVLHTDYWSIPWGTLEDRRCKGLDDHPAHHPHNRPSGRCQHYECCPDGSM